MCLHSLRKKASVNRLGSLLAYDAQLVKLWEDAWS